ncbi:MAG: hypothetical protein ISR53_09130 [Rhodospirillales bacterium]|nr:hypothetical protein [Rhodospirillales bacterium]
MTVIKSRESNFRPSAPDRSPTNHHRCLYTFGLGAQPHPFLAAVLADHIDQVMALPKAVFPRVVTVFDLEDFFQDFQVVGDFEGVAGVFITKEIIKIIEVGPGYRRQA